MLTVTVVLVEVITGSVAWCPCRHRAGLGWRDESGQQAWFWDLHPLPTLAVWKPAQQDEDPSCLTTASHSAQALRLGGTEGSISVSFVLVQVSALLERTPGSRTGDLLPVLRLFLAPYMWPWASHSSSRGFRFIPANLATSWSWRGLPALTLAIL